MTNEQETLFRFRLYLGTEIRPDRRYHEGETVDVNEAEAFVADSFPEGFSRFDAVGAWFRKDDGTLVRERTIVFEILAPRHKEVSVRVLAQVLKSDFRQDSVLLTVERLESATFV